MGNSPTLIYNQFDDENHGITVDAEDDGILRFTIYQGDVQTSHILTSNEAADLSSAIENNI